MLIRREAIDRVGMLDESLRIASDVAWLAQLRAAGATPMVDRVLYRKRLHGSNLGHTTAAQLLRSELLEVARQRAAAARAGAPE